MPITFEEKVGTLEDIMEMDRRARHIAFMRRELQRHAIESVLDAAERAARLGLVL